MADMEAAGVARSTRKATRDILANIFEMARRWGYLKDTDNPARGVEVGRTDSGARTIWTPTLDEARSIIDHVDAKVGLVIETIIWTGMRISEVVGLRCSNVDVVNAVVYVRERNVRRVIDTPKTPAGQRALPLGHLAALIAPRLAVQMISCLGSRPASPTQTWRLTIACARQWRLWGCITKGMRGTHSGGSMQL